MEDRLELIENFDGLSYLSNPRISESGSLLEIEIDILNANAIAVFMSLLVCLAAAIAYIFVDATSAVVILAAGLTAGSMFVGMMYLIANDERNQSLPYVDKESGCLVLASGTAIPNQKIVGFRQCKCNTRTSNFRLVLTSVIVDGSSGRMEYAVIPVQGSFSEDRLGIALADYFQVPLHRDDARKITVDEMATLGLS